MWPSWSRARSATDHAGDRLKTTADGAEVGRCISGRHWRRLFERRRKTPPAQSAWTRGSCTQALGVGWVARSAGRRGCPAAGTARGRPAAGHSRRRSPPAPSSGSRSTAPQRPPRGHVGQHAVALGHQLFGEPGQRQPVRVDWPPPADLGDQLFALGAGQHCDRDAPDPQPPLAGHRGDHPGQLQRQARRGDHESGDLLPRRHLDASEATPPTRTARVTPTAADTASCAASATTGVAAIAAAVVPRTRWVCGPATSAPRPSAPPLRSPPPRPTPSPPPPMRRSAGADSIPPVG